MTSIALRALLSGAIDYAGLFPPAKLAMAPSLENYLAYKHGPEAWIVSRFVSPASRLEELRIEMERAEVTDRIPVSVIGRGGKSRDEWEMGLEKDAADINAFLATAADRASIESYEARIPDNFNLGSYAADLSGFSDADTFVELTWDEGLSDALAELAEADFLKAKARTGGTEATAFPTSRQLGTFLQCCVQLALPFKLTAGLHQPSTHHDHDLGVRMHGFVNVFGATALALAHDLTLREIEELLDDDEPGAFQFDDAGLIHGELTADSEAISEARELFSTFGSCSVIEPLDGLRAAGLLTEAK